MNIMTWQLYDQHGYQKNGMLGTILLTYVCTDLGESVIKICICNIINIRIFFLSSPNTSRAIQTETGKKMTGSILVKWEKSLTDRQLPSLSLFKT